ncbi:unnamed protein product [Caenorhabditis brenneri]
MHSTTSANPEDTSKAEAIDEEQRVPIVFSSFSRVGAWIVAASAISRHEFSPKNSIGNCRTFRENLPRSDIDLASKFRSRLLPFCSDELVNRGMFEITSVRRFQEDALTPQRRDFKATKMT